MMARGSQSGNSGTNNLCAIIEFCLFSIGLNILVGASHHGSSSLSPGIPNKRESTCKKHFDAEVSKNMKRENIM